MEQGLRTKLQAELAVPKATITGVKATQEFHMTVLDDTISRKLQLKRVTTSFRAVTMPSGSCLGW